MKVAKLVTVSLITRVVVEDTATDEQIVNLATPKLIAKFALLFLVVVKVNLQGIVLTLKGSQATLFHIVKTISQRLKLS